MGCFNWSNFCWARHFYWSDPAPRSQKLVHWLKGGKWVFCYSRCAAEPPSNCHGLAKSQARQTVRSVERSLDPRAIDHERASPVDHDTPRTSTSPAKNTHACEHACAKKLLLAMTGGPSACPPSQFCSISNNGENSANEAKHELPWKPTSCECRPVCMRSIGNGSPQSSQKPKRSNHTA